MFARQRNSLEDVFSVTAYDRGIYLKKNETYRKVRSQTPEAVTAQLCAEFGIQTGALAATGVKISRNFLPATLYQVIQTMYTLASEQTGKQYQIRFRADTLEVVEKARGRRRCRLIPGSNLLSCESSESIENLVTSVAVYDEEYRRIATYDSTEGLRALYGLMQQAIKASDKEDPAKSAGRSWRRTASRPPSPPSAWATQSSSPATPWWSMSRSPVRTACFGSSRTATPRRAAFIRPRSRWISAT